MSKNKTSIDEIKNSFEGRKYAEVCLNELCHEYRGRQTKTRSGLTC